MAVHFQKIHGAIGGRTTPPLNIYGIESVATPASNTATDAYALGGWFLIFNGESGAIKVAWGTTPDADAVASTTSTTAYMVIPAGFDNSVPVLLQAGGKFEWKAA